MRVAEPFDHPEFVFARVKRETTKTTDKHTGSPAVFSLVLGGLSHRAPTLGTPGYAGPMRYGRIISWSSCSTM
jgi:hypothetical protein